MTRKEYVAIAAAIARCAEPYRAAFDQGARGAGDGMNAVACVARSVADAMARENGAFDRARFLAACGVRS